MGQNGKSKHKHGRFLNYIVNVLGCSGLGASTEASPKVKTFIDFRRVFFLRVPPSGLLNMGDPVQRGQAWIVKVSKSMVVWKIGRSPEGQIPWILDLRRQLHKVRNIHNIAISW